MARRVIGWVAGTLAVGLALAGYLRFVEGHPFMRHGGGIVAGAQAATREGTISYLTSKEEVRLQVARYRLRVEDLLESRPDVDSNSLVVAIDAPDWKEPPQANSMHRALVEAWEELGLGMTKVAVGVVVIDRRTARDIGHGLAVGAESPTAFYVLPDSLAPATCMVMVVAPQLSSQGKLLGHRSLKALARLWYGPCAYYARFGVPGKRVANWLEARGLDLALAPAWVATPDDTLPIMPGFSQRGEGRRWYWDIIYWMPPKAVGCLSGRAEVCRSALIEGDGPPKEVREWLIVQSDNAWRFTRQPITGGDHFLSAVLRQVGPRRFEEFWRTSLPIDSALTTALGAPVGEWTAQWQRQVAEPPHPGPALRWSELLVCVVTGALALGTLLWNVRFRSVS